MDEEIRNHLPTVVQRVRREAVLLAERELASKHTVPPCINADTGNTFFRFPAARRAGRGAVAALTLHAESAASAGVDAARP